MLKKTDKQAKQCFDRHVSRFQLETMRKNCKITSSLNSKKRSSKTEVGHKNWPNKRKTSKFFDLKMLSSHLKQLGMNRWFMPYCFI